MSTMIAKGLAGLATALICWTGTAAGQSGSTWIQLKPTVNPPYGSYWIAYDSLRCKAVLYGTAVHLFRSETYEWDGNDWGWFPSSSSPAFGLLPAMAFAPFSKRTILFGARGTGAETWEWDGLAWTLRQPPSSPPPLSDHAMVCDTARRRVVLFGGLDWLSGPPPKVGGDTWEWDGAAWTLCRPSSSPPARRKHGMVFDTARGLVVLFGGTDGSMAYSDTWEYDGNSWRPRQPPASPPARFGHGMAYDPNRGRTVLFGGDDGNQALLDTWEWDGTQWTKMSPFGSPSPLSYNRMAYVDHARQMLLVGADFQLSGFYTWRYFNLPGAFHLVGQGCLGSHGKVPGLSSSGPPRVFNIFRLDLANASPLAGSALLLGTGDPVLNLTPFGAPGCFAHSLPAAIFLYLPVGPGGTWNPPPTFYIPLDPALLGGVFYAQTLLFDQAANPLGVITTNGLKGVVGL